MTHSYLTADRTNELCDNDGTLKVWPEVWAPRTYPTGTLKWKWNCNESRSAHFMFFLTGALPNKTFCFFKTYIKLTSEIQMSCSPALFIYFLTGWIWVKPSAENPSVEAQHPWLLNCTLGRQLVPHNMFFDIIPPHELLPAWLYVSVPVTTVIGLQKKKMDISYKSPPVVTEPESDLITQWIYSKSWMHVDPDEHTSRPACIFFFLEVMVSETSQQQQGGKLYFRSLAFKSMNILPHSSNKAQLSAELIRPPVRHLTLKWLIPPTKRPPVGQGAGSTFPDRKHKWKAGELNSMETRVVKVLALSGRRSEYAVNAQLCPSSSPSPLSIHICPAYRLYASTAR